MIEKHIVLEDVDLLTFYGVNNSNMQIIKALYPKLRIVARGNVMKVLGDEEEKIILPAIKKAVTAIVITRSPRKTYCRSSKAIHETRTSTDRPSATA